MAGYPIQTPSDQRPVGSSPRPIAAPHVFHRSYVPRHPPYATPSTQPSTTHAYQPQTTLQVLSQMITLKHATPHHPTKTRVTRVWLQTHTHHTGRCMLASTIQLSNHHPTPHNPPSHQRKGNYEAGFLPQTIVMAREPNSALSTTTTYTSHKSR